MEMENELRNVRGIAGAGLGLGIAGTALGVLNGGGLGNILGTGGNSEKDAKIARLEADLGGVRLFDRKNGRIYLNETGLSFFFPPYTIASSTEGIPTFLFPYANENGPFSPNTLDFSCNGKKNNV